MATNINTIKNWFKTGLKPTQEQFWAWMDSYWHKDETIPQSSITDLQNTLNAKAEKSQLDGHKTDSNAHADLFAEKEDKTQKGIAGGYAPLDALTKLASAYLNIIDDLVTGGSTSILSAQQGLVLQNQIDGIKTILDSDDVNLDTIQEIVDAIKDVETYLANILVNDLTTGGVTKALTAEMGKQLQNTKLTATIATDMDAQIDTAIPEDNKVISRSVLFNWREWFKTQRNDWTGQNIFGNTALFQGQAVFYGSVIFDQPIAFDNATTFRGSTNQPQIIVQKKALVTAPQEGAIERDTNGQLWETHSGVRSRLITTADGLILVAYRSLNTIQTNLDTNISSTKQATSSSSVIGKISNDSVLNLNMINQLTNSQVGTVRPTVAKVEVFIKLNNGLFATHYTGANAVNQVKILEYSGTNMLGNKIYKNPIFTALQSNDPLTAQWSTRRIQGPIATSPLVI